MALKKVAADESRSDDDDDDDEEEAKNPKIHCDFLIATD